MIRGGGGGAVSLTDQAAMENPGVTGFLIR